MSIKWHYELILKCDIKNCNNNRKFSTEMGNPKSLESAAKIYGWDFGFGIVICPECGKKKEKYVKEKMAGIK